jgi:hypothetical protein
MFIMVGLGNCQQMVQITHSNATSSQPTWVFDQNKYLCRWNGYHIANKSDDYMQQTNKLSIY